MNQSLEGRLELNTNGSSVELLGEICGIKGLSVIGEGIYSEIPGSPVNLRVMHPGGVADLYKRHS